MHALSISPSYNLGLIVFTTICLCGVGFLIWFLIELLLDGKRSAGSSYRNRKHQVICFPIPINSRQVLRSNPVNRSSRTKRSALLMALLLSATFRTSAQSAEASSPKDQSSTQSSSQNVSAQTPAAPAPLSTPAVTGPLQAAPPIEFDAGPLGKLDLDGIVSGIGHGSGRFTDKSA